MIIDNQLVFSNAQAFTATTASATVIDLSGGTNFTFGNATRFGEDLGIGDGVAMPKIAAYVQTAAVTTNSGTLQIAFQGSTDSSNWTTYIESPAMAAALLTAGAKVASWDWPHRLTGAALPRYVRLNYTIANAITVGTIFAAIVLQRDDWPASLYPANYIAV